MMRLTSAGLACAAVFCVTGAAAQDAEESGFESLMATAIDYHEQFPVIPMRVEGAFAFSLHMENNGQSMSVECSFDYVMDDETGELIMSNVDPVEGPANQACREMTGFVEETETLQLTSDNLADILAAVGADAWQEIESTDDSIVYEAVVEDLYESNPDYQPMRYLSGAEGPITTRIAFSPDASHVIALWFKLGPALTIAAEYDLLDSGRPVATGLELALDGEDVESGLMINQMISLEITSVTELDDAGPDAAASTQGLAAFQDGMKRVLMNTVTDRTPDFSAFVSKHFGAAPDTAKKAQDPKTNTSAQ